MVDGLEDKRLGITGLAGAKARHHDVLGRPGLAGRRVADDSVAADGVAGEGELDPVFRVDRDVEKPIRQARTIPP